MAKLFGLIDLRNLIKPESIGAPQPRIAHRSGVGRTQPAAKGGKHTAKHAAK